jgi:hypothetical protein
MTIPKAMRADRAFIRRRNTEALRRWRIKNRDRWNAYMARYMRGYRKRKRAAASQ